LIESEEEQRFRCQVGHAFSAIGLAAAQSDELERALGIAVRTHRDRMKLFTQMKESARSRGFSYAEKRWEHASEQAEQMIGALEAAMNSLRKPTSEEV